jgi:hypothetical protein
LFPGPNDACQKDEEHPIHFRVCRPFHLPFEDDELLSQEGVFCHQLGLAFAKLGEGLEWLGRRERFGPLTKASGECMPAAIQEPPERGQNTCHTKIFSIP